MNNPFSLTFGKEPVSMISRNLHHNEIITGFMSDNPEYQVCMITGVRGAGKTVAMTAIAHQIATDRQWTVINLNPERNLLDSMAANIKSMRLISNYLEKTKISLSAFGIGLTMNGQPAIGDSAIFLDKALKKLKEKKKKILITIDEVVVNQNIKEFISQLQIYIRENYPVFLIMTGLFENIFDLQNEKTMTFLYRAPKIELPPLSLPLIAAKYADIFHLNEAEALEMARLTSGYPFAYQSLGYLCCKYQKSYKEIIPEYDSLLEEYVYEKIWSEMSEADKKVAGAISRASSSKVADIRQQIGIDSNKFNIYRKRLLKKGIIQISSYGHIKFMLPRFSEFVQRNL